MAQGDKGTLAADVAEALSDPAAQEQIDSFVQAVTEGEQAPPAPEAPATAGELTPVSPGESAAGEQPNRPAPVAETPAPAEGTAPEPPSQRFGLDFSDLPPEARAEAERAFQEQNQLISRLMQERAERNRGPAQEQVRGVVEETVQSAPAPQAPPAEDPALDTDALGRLLGFDPNDPFYEVKMETAAPLAQEIINIRQELTTQAEDRQLEQLEAYWTSTLEALEAQYVDLPISHDEVVRYAAENGISDPAAAYWAISGPSLQKFMQVIDTQRKTQMDTLKQDASTLRPVGSQPVAPAPLQAPNTKDAVALAAAQAAKESGLDWDSVIKGTVAAPAPAVHPPAPSTAVAAT